MINLAAFYRTWAFIASALLIVLIFFVAWLS